METLISYGFLQRALLAGVFIAISCALLGVFLLLRRDAMIGHGLSHLAFAGVALGLFLNVMPVPAAIVVTVLGALGIRSLKTRAGLSGDTAIGILSSVGMGAGIILVSISHKFNAGLFGYLFGEILAIEPSEVWLSVFLAAIVILSLLLNYHKLMYMTFDWESAKASGIRVGRLDLLLTLLTAVTVVLGIKVVGILLVAALVVIPAASSLRLATNFKRAVIGSCVFALASVLIGLPLSFFLDLPASGSIVLISLAFFAACALTRKRK
jgi:zinc transport system permease protein